MEALIEHVLEPELTGPAPRRLHLPLRVLLLLSVASLLLGLFILGSGRALWEGVKFSWLAEAGQTINGQIIGIRTESPLPKGQAPRQTAICYGGDIPSGRGFVRRTGWIVLDQSAALPGVEMVRNKPHAALQFHLGQPVPLRYAAVLGMTVCQPWGPDPAAHIFPLFLAGGLILAVSVLLLLRLVRWAESRLHLLRQGMATIGTITHKRAESEDMVRYFLRYGYADNSAHDRDHEEQVSADQWRKFHVGQPVTVLYDPDFLEKAGLYALMKF